MNRAPFAMACATLVLLPLLAEPFATPDTIEMVASGRCLLGLETNELLCQTLDTARWSLPFSLLAGMTSVFASTYAIAGALAGLIGTATLMGAMTALAPRNHWAAGACAALVAIAIPALRLHGLAGDARTLALAALVAAWCLVPRPEEQMKRSQAIGIGILTGLAVLIRPEMLAGATVLLIALGWWHRKGAAIPVAAAAFTALVPRLWSRGITGRDWEMGALSLLDVLPEGWVFQLVGLGVKEAPFRAYLPSETSSSLHPANAMGWIVDALPVAIPFWWWPLVVWGGLVAWKNHRTRLIIAGSIAAPSLGVLLLPQARDAQLTAQNLLGLLVGGCTLAGPVIWDKLRTTFPWRIRLPLLGILCLSLGFITRYPSVSLPMETGSVHQEMATWIHRNVPEGEGINATFLSGGMVLEGHRARMPLPSSWELQGWLPPGSSQMVLITSIDHPAALATLAELQRLGKPEILAAFKDMYTSATLIRVTRDES